MRRVEKLLEQARNELAKVKHMLDKSTLKKRHTSLAAAKKLEQETLPTPEERWEEEHRFAAYEADLQKMMVPMEEIIPKPPKKKKTKKKAVKKTAKKKSTKKRVKKAVKKKGKKSSEKPVKSPSKKSVKKTTQKSKKGSKRKKSIKKKK